MTQAAFEEKVQTVQRLREVLQEYTEKTSAAEQALLRHIKAHPVGAILEGKDEATDYWETSFAVRERILVVQSPALVSVHYRGWAYPLSQPGRYTQRGRFRAHKWIDYKWHSSKERK